MTGDSPDAADVAVVIVNYRTPGLTADAARSVIGQPGVNEVVVVDNGSGDGSVEALTAELTGPAAPEVEVVASSDNLGFGQGCDIGVGRSTAPLLMFLNSDATVAPGAVALLGRVLAEDPGVGVVAPAVYGRDGIHLQVDVYGVFPSIGAMLSRANRRPADSLSPDWVSGVAMMVRRSDYLEVGGFDPAFHMYLEDVDLCRRMRAAGKGVRREPDARVTHLGSRLANVEERRQYHRSQRIYFQKAGAGPITMAGARAAAVLRSRPDR